MAQDSIFQPQIRRALRKRSFGRLFDVLTSSLPETPPDLIENGITEYLEAPKSAYLFDDEIAAIPGQYDSFWKLGHFYKAGLLDSAVSLDLLLFLDEHINEAVYANAPVGQLNKAVTLNVGTSFEERVEYEPLEHPMVLFGMRNFYEETYREAFTVDSIYSLSEDWSGIRKFTLLSISQYEGFQTQLICRIVRLYLRSLTDFIRELGTSFQLAQVLFNRIQEAVSMNPRVDLRFFHFDLITTQAQLLANEEEQAPIRRRLYEYIAELPRIDQVPKKLKVVKDPERFFDASVRAGRKPKTSLQQTKGRVLEFPTVFEKREPAAKTLPPKCPLCESPLSLRENRRTHQPFWGCSNFPKCRHTQRVVTAASDDQA